MLKQILPFFNLSCTIMKTEPPWYNRITHMASDHKLRVRVLPGAHHCINMKKVPLFFLLALAIAFSVFQASQISAQGRATITSSPQGLVPCGNGSPSDPGFRPCQLSDVFVLARNVYIFLVWIISVPLAGLMMMIGGVLMLLGGSSMKLHDMGKGILRGAAWAMALILGSWVIIGIVLFALGYQSPTGNWFTFSF